MRYKRIPAYLLLCLLSYTGCVSGKMDKASQVSKDWPLIKVDSIPKLEAVEIPLDSLVVSQMLLEKMAVEHRIPLTDKMVIAFESWSPIGLLNPDRPNNIRYEDARQFAAFCTINKKVSLIYNFVGTGSKSCKYLSDRWRSDIVMDSECTSLGVFESEMVCPLPDSPSASK